METPLYMGQREGKTHSANFDLNCHKHFSKERDGLTGQSKLYRNNSRGGGWLEGINEGKRGPSV